MTALGQQAPGMPAGAWVATDRFWCCFYLHMYSVHLKKKNNNKLSKGQHQKESQDKLTLPASPISAPKGVQPIALPGASSALARC